MAYDVANFIQYMQRRSGGKYPDRAMRQMIVTIAIVALALPLKQLLQAGYFKGMLTYRQEVYAVRDGIYYSHFRGGQKSIKAPFWKGVFWG